MNTSNQSEAGIFKTDKTYDLGKGITVTVARAVQFDREPLQVLPTNQNWAFKSPMAKEQSLRGYRSKMRHSPLQNVAKKSISRTKNEAKASKQPQESATVCINRSLTPKRQTVIDFSDPHRKTACISKGVMLTQMQKPHKSTHSASKQFKTSRERISESRGKVHGKLKQQSECNIHAAVLRNSSISDLMQSGFCPSQSQPTMEATATFGQPFQEDETGLQWQHLAMRCESIDISLALTESNLADLDDKRRVLEAEEDRLKTKAIFLLDKLSAIPDTECKAKCQVDPGMPDFWAKVDDAGQAVAYAVLSIDEIESAIKERCEWFGEFKFLAETIEDESVREKKRAEKALERVEDLESMLTEDQKKEVSSFLSPELMAIDLDEAVSRVYQAKLARIKLEAIEKLTICKNKNDEELASLALEVSGLSREIDEIDTEEVVMNLCGLKAIERSDLLQIIFLLRRFLEAIVDEKTISDYSIDPIEEFKYVVNTQLPSLSNLLDTVISTLYDNTNLSTLSILNQLLQSLLDYSMFVLNNMILTAIMASIGPATFTSPTLEQESLLSLIFDLSSSSCQSSSVVTYHSSRLLVKATQSKAARFDDSLRIMTTAVMIDASMIDSVDIKVMLSELNKNKDARLMVHCEAEKARKERESLEERVRELRRELERAEKDMKEFKAGRDEKSRTKEIVKCKKSRENSRSLSNATKHRSSSSVIKKSDSSLYIGAKELAIQSLEEELDDDPFEKLDEKGKLSVNTLISKLNNSKGKSSFSRKLMKLLDSDFNLDHHCVDWVSRGHHGLKIKKGPKYTFSTAGSKKVDTLELWTQICKSKNVDLEKKGFCQRLLRLEPTSGVLALLKPYKKTQCEGYWDTTHMDSLENYNISIDEVN